MFHIMFPNVPKTKPSLAKECNKDALLFIAIFGSAFGHNYGKTQKHDKHSVTQHEHAAQNNYLYEALDCTVRTNYLSCTA